MAVDPRWEENQRVFQAASGSANELVPALASIVSTGHWREFVHPMRGVVTFASFADYCDEFLGLSPQAVEALLDKTNAKAAAREVRRMLAEAVEPQRSARGGPVPSNSSDTKVSEQPDATYVLARLKRDDPDLARQVIDGQVSANAAAIQAGIRRRYVRVRPDDVRQAVGVLLKHYSRQQLLEALDSP